MLKLVSIVIVCLAARLGGAATPATRSGIPLDKPFKRAIYEFAVKEVVHPAWGLAHSERDFQVARRIAAAEGIAMDEDVLFAASFLHDVGGLAPYAKSGVDHAERSVQVVEPLLVNKFGFPEGKVGAVKEMILGHVYYGAKPTSRAALAFRDADVVDFLGAVGAARILAVTQEKDFADGTLAPTVKTLKQFSLTMADACSLEACREIAKLRKKELANFLSLLDEETFGGRAL